MKKGHWMVYGEDIDCSIRKSGTNIAVLVAQAYWDSIVSINDDTQIIERIINDDSYTVTYTGVSYRQISYLAEHNMLNPEVKPGEGGWKKFRFRDVVYLRILQKYREFGMSYMQLRGLHSLFYEEPRTMDEVIFACIAATEMTMTIYSDGTGFVMCPIVRSADERVGGMFLDKSRPAIHLNLNAVVDEVLASTNKKSVETEVSLARLLSSDAGLTEAEKQALEAIRNRGYYRVEITKKDGKPFVMHVTTNEERVLTDHEILKRMRSQDFGDMTFSLSNGEIVHVKNRITVKL